MTSCKLPPPSGISVVIPTMNRAAVLLDTLRDLRKQTFRDYEVIVVDQSDEPNPTAEALLAEFGVPARYCHVTHFRGLPKARNFGWRLAQRDVVLYTDDDIRCGPGFLQAHFDAHTRTGAAMVAGGISEEKGDVTQRGAPGSFNWWTATPVANFHLDQPGWCVFGKGCNFSIRRAVLDALGGFDARLSIGASLYEETELALRLSAIGLRCWFAPDAHVVHLAAPMGGCRVGPDVPRYVYGMGHNRAILIFRHLRPWHRPSAIVRMLLYGLAYSRADRSLRSLVSAISGMMAGRSAARAVLKRY